MFYFLLVMSYNKNNGKNSYLNKWLWHIFSSERQKDVWGFRSWGEICCFISECVRLTGGYGWQAESLEKRKPRWRYESSATIINAIVFHAEVPVVKRLYRHLTPHWGIILDIIMGFSTTCFQFSSFNDCYLAPPYCTCMMSLLMLPSNLVNIKMFYV